MRKILFLLSQLDQSDLDWIMKNGVKSELADGQVLIEKGKAIDTLFIVLDGMLELSGVDIGSQPIRLGCGEVIGEISLLDSRPPTATLTACTNAVVLAVPREVLAEKLKSDVSFAARFYHSLASLLAHRLRKTYQKLGYGEGQSLEEDTEYEDELSPEMLDSVHLTGTRFSQALKRKLLE